MYVTRSCVVPVTNHVEYVAPSSIQETHHRCPQCGYELPKEEARRKKLVREKIWD